MSFDRLATDGSPASKRLMAWRDNLVGGALRDYGAMIPKGNNPNGLVRTGTMGSPTNDFDWSCLGPHSTANRDDAFKFLEERFGLGRAEMKSMLDGELFTDPRRLHLYDELEPGLRETMAKAETEFSEKLVYNRMLYEAERRGASDDFKRKLMDEMKSRHIDVGYVEMSAADIGALSRDIDTWHQQLQAAATYEAKERLVRRIGEAQGQINAVEHGGYLTGGGAAEFAKLPDVPALPLTKHQLYGAALDQLLKLFDAVDEFEQLSRLVLDASLNGRMADAIKRIGKYGTRFNEMAAVGLFSPVSGDLAATLDRLGDALEIGWKPSLMSDLTGQARSGAVLRQLGPDAATVIKQTREAIGDLVAKQDDLLTGLRLQAGMYDVAGDTRSLLAIQKATIARVHLRRAWDIVKVNLSNIEKAAESTEELFSADTTPEPGHEVSPSGGVNRPRG